MDRQSERCAPYPGQVTSGYEKYGNKRDVLSTCSPCWNRRIQHLGIPKVPDWFGSFHLRLH